MSESPSRRGFIIGGAASLIAAPAIVRAASLMQLRGEPLRTLSVPLSKPRALTLPVWVSFDVRDADGVFLHVVKRLEGIEAADVVRYGFMRVPLLDMLPDNSSRYAEFANVRATIKSGPSAIEDFAGPVDDGLTIMSRL